MNDSSPFYRYRRQTLVEEVGKEGQKKLARSIVLIVGCGGLGTVISSNLVRAGVGKVIVVDHDIVELDNLHRQVLFDEQDVDQKLPKAMAAADRLRKINSQVSVEPVVAELSAQNIEEMLSGVDLVFDGTDNFETRFLINDACVKHDIPWIYGGVVATYGTSFTIIPDETPCLRCFVNELPSPGSIPTCQTVGVLGTAVNIVASIEVTEGLKLLLGKKESLLHKLISVDVWSGSWQLSEIKRISDCPACGQHRFDFLME